MKILLVKLSSLGDVVHAMPVVQDIRAALPDARIDWVVEKSFASLLSLSPGLGRVIPCKIRRWSKAPLAAETRREWSVFKANLQVESYDAVLDLQGLTKSALVARLARLSPGGKRYALANQTEGSGYEAPTRWVADVSVRMQPHIHAVQRSRELAARALGYKITTAPDFGLNKPVAQTGRAQTAIEKVARKITSDKIAFVHGTSRADKEWPLAHWVELGQRLISTGFDILLPHGSSKEMATSQAIADALNAKATNGQAGPAHVLPVLELAVLTKTLGDCAAVIGVDSGLSHIAVALDVPHVQIYNFDTCWRTGPDESSGRQRSLFAQPTPEVEAVWQSLLACLRASE